MSEVFWEVVEAFIDTKGQLLESFRTHAGKGAIICGSHKGEGGTTGYLRGIHRLHKNTDWQTWRGECVAASLLLRTQAVPLPHISNCYNP